MITDIPTAEEFRLNGLEFLNLAWDNMLKTQHEKERLDGFKRFNGLQDLEEDQRQTKLDLLNKRAQQSLSVGVALAQQGSEFLLKSKIASVSPFLLISCEPPSRWPTAQDESLRVPFANFKTIDATELVRVHNTACAEKLPERFVIQFERLRKVRNSVMHSVDKQRSLTARDIALAILDAVDTLIGACSWQPIRQQFTLERYEVNWLSYHRAIATGELSNETAFVIDDLLQPAEVKRFYDFNVKQRRYSCPFCSQGYRSRDGKPLAQLKPNEPTSTKIHCITCCDSFDVVRSDCPQENCPGNVIHHGEAAAMCLTCEKTYDV